MDSMTDDDITLPIDFNGSTQVPRVMEADMSSNTTMNETAVPGKFSEVHTMKDHEMHISELRKENFELKLRIYFLEEKLQHSQTDSDEDAFKMNIELKVEIEKLKNELNEKRRLLVKASAAVDSLDRNNQEQIKKLRDQHNRDIDQVKQSYEMKVREYDELLNNERRQSDSLKDKLAESERMNRKIKDDFSKPGLSTMESTEMQAKFQATLREKERIIDELKSAVDIRESRIKQLDGADEAEIKKQIKGLNQKIEERDVQVQELKEKLSKSELSVKNLREELHDKEIRFQLTSQANNSSVQKLNEKFNQKQAELDEVQEKFRVLQENLEKAQDIIDQASLKDVEAFQEKSKALKAKDALIAELQGYLKQREMENDHLTRTLGRKDVELQKMIEAKNMRDEAEQKIYEKEQELTAIAEQLASTKSKLRETIDKHEEQLQKTSLDHQNQLSAKDQTIRRVTDTLDEKESIIQDLIVAQQNMSQSSSLDGITDSKEELVQKLRDRLKERDAAVEANIEQKFQVLRDKEEELQELRKGLRERDRLIENINAAVIQHEDTANNLQSVVAEKESLINDLKLSLQNQQKQLEEANEFALKKSRENEGLIEKLKRNLANRDQQIENLEAVLQRNALKEVKDVEENALLNELSAALKEKEKMLADILAERSQMIAQNEDKDQKMINTLLEKEKLLKEVSEKMEQVFSEKNATISRLQQHVNSLNLDIQSLENSKGWTLQENEILLGKLRQSLAEKERTIEKLINSGKEKDKVFLKLQECTTNKTTSPVRLEISNLKNTIQDLTNELQEKKDIIERLEKTNRENEVLNTDKNNIANLEYAAELELEIEHRDSLLKQAAESIEAFKAKLNNLPVIEELKKNLEQTQQALSTSEVQRNKLQAHVDKMRKQESAKVQSLENEMALLKQERDTWLLQDNFSERQPEDKIKRLQDLLQEQMHETSKLGQLLQKERDAYENIMKQTKIDPGYDSFSNMNEEFEVISQLRKSLEDGLAQNNKLRTQLLERISSSPEPQYTEIESSQLEEVKRLQAKLEDSERWNMSLQSRLDALQPRARGVGGSTGNLTTIGTTPSSQKTNDTDAAAKTTKLEELKLQLDETQKMNAKLQKQLQNASRNEPEDLSAQTRPNEQQKQEINLLREELKKANDVCDELRTAVKKADAEMSSYKKEHDNEFNSLQRALEDSQKFIEALQERSNEQKEDKENQTSFNERAHLEPDGAGDGRSQKSPGAPGTNQVNKLQRELQEMYRKNDELRKTVSGNMKIVEMNQQLKQNLLTSQQNNTLLAKQLEDTMKKLNDMTSEVTRLEQELDTAHALNLDYVSQLKTSRDQVEESSKLREDIVMAKKVNEKLKSEIQRLLSSLERMGRENERLKELIVEKNNAKSPVISTSSTPSTFSRSGVDSTDAGSSMDSELQSLQKRLEMSEKLNTALKYELEVNKKSGASGEPFVDHVEELRQLRSRLEESIKTYDALCVQLEEKLSELNEGEEKKKGLEDRLALTKENEGLRAELAQFTQKMKNIQRQLEGQRMAGKKDKEQISLMRNQLMESNKSNESLRKELAIFDRVMKLDQPQSNGLDGSRSSQSSGTTNNDAILLLMSEIRSLRKQLEASIESNNSLRQMLQSQLSSPQRQTAVRSSSTGPTSRGMETSTSSVPPVSDNSPTRLSTSTIASKDNGVNVVMESESLEQLRQYVNTSFHNSESLLIKMTKLTLEGHDKDGHLDDLKKDLEKLRSLLFKSNMLLDRLWAQHLSSGPTVADRLTEQNAELQKEITALKKRVLSQSKILENTANRLESSSRMRKEVERSLFARLSETRETLGSARKNLQDRLAARNDTLT